MRNNLTPDPERTSLARPEPAPSLDRKALTEAALAYLGGDLSIIPVNARKTPALKEWKPYQTNRPTREQIKKWAHLHSVAGFAAVCGEVSGGLTILDFDVSVFYERWVDLVGEPARELPTQRTGSGGYQVGFRSGLKTGNDKLAYAPANNKEGREIAIESRGESGYAVLPPSFCNLAVKRGKRHQQPYRCLIGDFAKIPIISEAEAKNLIEVARSLCQVPLSKKQMQAAPLSPWSNGGAGGNGVIGAFNGFYELGAILSRNGYQAKGKRYLAPDSTTGIPGVHIFENGRCFSHHGNDPLNDGHSHDPFSVFCILEHGGDVRAAVKAAAVELGIERTRDRPQPPPADDGQDYDQAERAAIREEAQAKPQGGAPKTAAIKFVTGAELEVMDFPGPVWLIPGILGEGYVILAGRPKLGKSWLGLCLAVAVATGGCALGKEELRATQGRVLYLALEDRLRRIKNRLKQILSDTPFPEQLLLGESCERMDRGGLDELRSFLAAHPDCRLLVIDTLAKVRPPRQRNIDPYAHDALVGGSLQTLAHDFNTSILAIHHTRKGPADDPLDEVSGTTAITGAADSILILKRGRGKVDATLSITGRDIEEQDLALKFHPAEGAWDLMGDAAEYAKSEERQEIVRILRESGPITATQLAEISGKNITAIRKILWRMKTDGEIKIDEKDRYFVS